MCQKMSKEDLYKVAKEMSVLGSHIPQQIMDKAYESIEHAMNHHSMESKLDFLQGMIEMGNTLVGVIGAASLGTVGDINTVIVASVVTAARLIVKELDLEKKEIEFPEFL